MIALVVCTLVAIWARAEMFALVDYLVMVDIVSFYCPTVERSHPIQSFWPTRVVVKESSPREEVEFTEVYLMQSLVVRVSWCRVMLL